MFIQAVPRELARRSTCHLPEWHSRFCGMTWKAGAGRHPALSLPGASRRLSGSATNFTAASKAEALRRNQN